MQADAPCTARLCPSTRRPSTPSGLLYGVMRARYRDMNPASYLSDAVNPLPTSSPTYAFHTALTPYAKSIREWLFPSAFGGARLGRRVHPPPLSDKVSRQHHRSAAISLASSRWRHDASTTTKFEHQKPSTLARSESTAPLALELRHHARESS